MSVCVCIYVCAGLYVCVCGIYSLILVLCVLYTPSYCSCVQETRLKEGIVKLQPQEEPLRSELLSGKFTVLVSLNSAHLHT